MKGSPAFYRRVLPALLYMLGIFVGGSVPRGIDTGLEFSYQDKVLHLLVFGGLVVLVDRALSALLPTRRQSTRLWLGGWRHAPTAAVTPTAPLPSPSRPWTRSTMPRSSEPLWTAGFAAVMQPKPWWSDDGAAWGRFGRRIPHLHR